VAEDSSIQGHGVPFIGADAIEDLHVHSVDMPHVTQDLLARGTMYSPRPVFGNLLGGRRDLSFGIYGRADEARRLLDEKWSGEFLSGRTLSQLLGDDRTKQMLEQDGVTTSCRIKKVVSKVHIGQQDCDCRRNVAVLMCLHYARAERDLPLEMLSYCPEI